MPKLLRGRAPVKVCHTRHGVIRRAASPARRRQHRRSWHLDRLGAQTVCCCPSSVACTLLMTTICTHTCWHFARSISARFLLLLRARLWLDGLGSNLGRFQAGAREVSRARVAHIVSARSRPLFRPISSSWRHVAFILWSAPFWRLLGFHWAVWAQILVGLESVLGILRVCA